MYIVITGDVVDGLEFYGPFDDACYAGDWAGEIKRLEEWIVAPLQEVDDES